MKFFLINVALTIGMAATCGSIAAEQHSGAILLRDAVVIDHPGPVFLSDLLPPNSPSTLGNASGAIEICQAPRAGSVRVLRAEQILQVLNAHADLLQQLKIPSRIVIRYSGHRVSDGSVQQAISEFLRGHGWDGGLPAGTDLEVPEIAVAEGESLRVVELHWDVQRRAIQVRFRCSQRRACAVFLGYVRMPQGLPQDLHTALLRAISADSGGPPKTAAPQDRHTPLIEKGKAATLILEDTSMRISVPVICLEPGLLNQDIRVFDKHSRRIFVAQVVGDHLLRARL